MSCITIYVCIFTNGCNMDGFLDEILQLYNISDKNI